MKHIKQYSSSPSPSSTALSQQSSDTLRPNNWPHQHSISQCLLCENEWLWDSLSRMSIYLSLGHFHTVLKICGLNLDCYNLRDLSHMENSVILVLFLSMCSRMSFYSVRLSWMGAKGMASSISVTVRELMEMLMCFLELVLVKWAFHILIFQLKSLLLDSVKYWLQNGQVPSNSILKRLTEWRGKHKNIFLY